MGRRRTHEEKGEMLTTDLNVTVGFVCVSLL
jgi:hypothetical protein